MLVWSALSANSKKLSGFTWNTVVLKTVFNFNSFIENATESYVCVDSTGLFKLLRGGLTSHFTWAPSPLLPVRSRHSVPLPSERAAQVAEVRLRDTHTPSPPRTSSPPRTPSPHWLAPVGRLQTSLGFPRAVSWSHSTTKAPSISSGDQEKWKKKCFLEVLSHPHSHHDCLGPCDSFFLWFKSVSCVKLPCESWRTREDILAGPHNFTVCLIAEVCFRIRFTVSKLVEMLW